MKISFGGGQARIQPINTLKHSHWKLSEMKQISFINAFSLINCI